MVPEGEQSLLYLDPVFMYHKLSFLFSIYISSQRSGLPLSTVAWTCLIKMMDKPIDEMNLDMSAKTRVLSPGEKAVKDRGYFAALENSYWFVGTNTNVRFMDIWCWNLLFTLLCISGASFINVSMYCRPIGFHLPSATHHLSFPSFFLNSKGSLGVPLIPGS